MKSHEADEGEVLALITEQEKLAKEEKVGKGLTEEVEQECEGWRKVTGEKQVTNNYMAKEELEKEQYTWKVKQNPYTGEWIRFHISKKEVENQTI